MMSIVETLICLPSLFSKPSVAVDIWGVRFTDSISFIRFFTTSATSTPREMNFPRALIIAESFSFNCIIVAITYFMKGLFPIKISLVSLLFLLGWVILLGNDFFFLGFF